MVVVVVGALIGTVLAALAAAALIGASTAIGALGLHSHAHPDPRSEPVGQPPRHRKVG
jgi:hypothetical protein